jgi:hypothetical protein
MAPCAKITGITVALNDFASQAMIEYHYKLFTATLGDKSTWPQS